MNVMARNIDPVIISCAVTGAIHTPSMSEYLPVTPKEITNQGIEAANAGASIIHVHVRDPDTGEPVSDIELFKEVAEGIKAETDAIVQPTTGGGTNQTVEERFGVIPELQPEMASCNMGSINFGTYPLINAIEEFQFDWEPRYLKNTWDFIFQNTFGDIREALQMFEEHGVMPELECYDVGHLYNAKHFYDKNLLEPPLHIQFVMGIHGGIAAEEQHLIHMINTTDRLFGNDASWSVIGAGQKQFPFGCQAVSMGGNVRVGLEDNLFIEHGELAKSNAHQVEKMADLAWKVAGREPATPNEVREFFNLKGQSKVTF